MFFCQKLQFLSRGLFMKMKRFVFFMMLDLLVNLCVTSGYSSSGCDHPADVVFILDSSSSIYPPDFQKQLEFVNSLVSGFNIGTDSKQTQVGLITFGEFPWLKFSLNKFTDKAKLLTAIDKVKFRPGYSTRTDLAIDFLTKHLFTEKYGGRPDVDHIAIVITDGKSTLSGKTQAAAARARDANIQMFAIGVGQRFSLEELQIIASDPDEKYVYTVNSYSALQSILDDLAVRACEVTTTTTTTESTTSTTTQSTISTTQPITTTTQSTSLPTTDPPQKDQECKGEPKDVYFLIDSSGSIGWKNYKIQKEFIKDLISDFGIDQNGTRIGIVIFSETYKLSIPLGSISNIARLMSEIDRLPYLRRGTNTGIALRFVKEEGFLNGLGRPNADKIIILLTDGLSRNPNDTAIQAKKARESGINIFAIGIGAGADKKELHDIASSPASKYVLMVTKFEKLRSKGIRDHIVTGSCIRNPNDQASCSPKGLLDLMFVYDSFNLGAKRSGIISEFIASVTNKIKTESDKIHVGRLVDNCPDEGDIPLSPASLVDLEDIKLQDMQRILGKLQTMAFVESNGGRSDADSTAIVFLDTESDDIRTTLETIKTINNSVIKVHVVLIGDQKQLSPVNVDGHALYSVDSYDRLTQFTQSFLRTFCMHISK